MPTYTGERMMEMDHATTKKPGRKSESPTERLVRLQRDLQMAKRAVKEAEYRTYATVGEGVMAEADEDAEFKMRLREILRRRVTSKMGKADIAVVLAE
jgi:hypothetical protein